MDFWLGAHMPHWLRTAGVPLFVSHRRLVGYRRLPRARAPWVLDSGAFSQVALSGRFLTSARQYVAAVRRYRDEVGNLVWAAPQDHMCEPWVLARSEIASTVLEAQRWTVENYLELRHLDAELPIIPVLQGQTLADYWRCADMYQAAGVDLTLEPLVGLGSVCRRQATLEIANLIGSLSLDLRLHGFGVKTDGLGLYGEFLASADSMAWSYRGRRIRPCPHRPELTSCANCLPHALTWRRDVLDRPLGDSVQLALL